MRWVSVNDRNTPLKKARVASGLFRSPNLEDGHNPVPLLTDGEGLN